MAARLAAGDDDGVRATCDEAGDDDGDAATGGGDRAATVTATTTATVTRARRGATTAATAAARRAAAAWRRQARARRAAAVWRRRAVAVWQRRAGAMAATTATAGRRIRRPARRRGVARSGAVTPGAGEPRRRRGEHRRGGWAGASTCLPRLWHSCLRRPLPYRSARWDGLCERLLAAERQSRFNVLVRPTRISPRQSGAAGPRSTLRGCAARPGSSVAYCSPAAPTGPSP